jgi:hypothetical protein
MRRKILAFSSVVEIGTALVLMLDPAIVVRLLLGVDIAGVGVAVGRCFGIALLALGIACWPPRQGEWGGFPAFRAMLVYNALIALFLIYLFVAEHLAGIMLWPAAVLHAAVALLLAWTWRGERNLAAPGQ